MWRRAAPEAARSTGNFDALPELPAERRAPAHAMQNVQSATRETVDHPLLLSGRPTFHLHFPKMAGRQLLLDAPGALGLTGLSVCPWAATRFPIVKETGTFDGKRELFRGVPGHMLDWGRPRQFLDMVSSHAKELQQHPCFLTYESEGIRWGDLASAFLPGSPAILLMLREPYAWTDSAIKHDWMLLGRHTQGARYGGRITDFADSLVRLGCFKPSDRIAPDCAAAGQTRDYTLRGVAAVLLDAGLRQAELRLSSAAFGIVERYAESVCLLRYQFGQPLRDGCEKRHIREHAYSRSTGASGVVLNRSLAPPGMDYGDYSPLYYEYALPQFDSRLEAMRRAHVDSARAAGSPVKQGRHSIRSGRDPGAHVGTEVRPIAQRRHAYVPATNGRATNCTTAARPLAVYIYDWTTLTPAVHAVFGPEAEPNWRLYQLWASQASSLRVNFARVESKPPSSNLHSRHQRGGGPRPSGSTLRGLSNANPVRLASWPFAQTEDPAFLVQGHLRRALAAWEKRGVGKIVEEPGLADVIIWAVWDFAFCRAFNFHPLGFQSVRGILPHSCPAHWKLLQWLTQTPVWKSSRGDKALRCTPRHIILGTHLHSTRLRNATSFRGVQTFAGWPKDPTKADFFDWREMQPVVDATKALNGQASWIVLENRQRHTTTRSIIAPYYSQCVLPYAVTSGSRSHLLFFAGGTQKKQYCAACENGISPRAIREKLVDDMLTHCGEACEVLAIRSTDAAGLATQPAVYQTGMANATFCPVPRGDSATSKRLYDCILHASIPVLISDHFPLPFQNFINYRAGMLFFREREFMLPAFSLTKKLRNLSQHKVAVLQAGVICLRDLLSYVSHPDDCPESAPCSSMGWVNLLIATILDAL